MTLPTNFKVARFDSEKSNGILHQLEADIDAIRFDTPEGKIELPVKLRFHDSVFVPLAKWAMLMAGNYRCIYKMECALRRKLFTLTSRITLDL